MSIIERTQYSADGGKTWADTEREARADHVHAELAKKMGAGWANNVLHTIETYPDALIQAMCDMGALPIDGGQAAQHGYRDGYRDALEYAVNNGSICLHGLTYAVVPIKEYQRAAAALEAIKAVARGDGPIFSASDWCDANHINWRDD